MSLATRKMDVELPNGLVFRDVRNDDDVTSMVKVMKALNLSTDQWAQLLAGKEPVYKHQETISAPQATSAASRRNRRHYGAGNGSAVRYSQEGKLAPKTFYEYSNYPRKFVAWLETQKNSKHVPIRAVQRADIADYIDDLLAERLNERTIQQKYLGAINGLFSLAQTTGALPEG